MLSVCMIVKNEEKNIERCLNSVKRIADEIVIVDTGSTDKTKEIASKFTDKIYDFKWIGNFSAARNFSIEKSTGEWILVLDADESISFLDYEKIKEITKSPEADAYHLIWRDYTNDIGVIGWKSSKGDIYEESKIASGFSETPVLRLFRNKYKFEGRIHETVQNSVKEQLGKIFMTDIVIHHYGSLRKKSEINEKKELYSKLLRERLNEKEKEKENYEILYELARELAVKGDYEEARKALEESIKFNSEFLNSLLMLGGIYIIEKDLDKAEKLLKKAAMINGNNADVHANLGVIYSKKGNYEKALKKFKRALELNPRSADYYFNIGIIYSKMGKEKMALFYFDKASELNPEYRKRIS